MASNNIEKLDCQGCDRVFYDKNTLEKHMLVCIKPKEGVSFSNMWKMRPHTGGDPLKLTLCFTNEETVEKVLPQSQELLPSMTQNGGPETQSNTANSGEHACDTCTKKFQKARGLAVHKRSCKGITESSICLQPPPAMVNFPEENSPENTPVGTGTDKVWGNLTAEELIQSVRTAYMKKSCSGEKIFTCFLVALWGKISFVK